MTPSFPTPSGPFRGGWVLDFYMERFAPRLYAETGLCLPHMTPHACAALAWAESGARPGREARVAQRLLWALVRLRPQPGPPGVWHYDASAGTLVLYTATEVCALLGLEPEYEEWLAERVHALQTQETPHEHD
ncbi:MAG: hypothetical protein ACYCOR_09745 [Acidobacteriaceae bacterium]